MKKRDKDSIKFKMKNLFFLLLIFSIAILTINLSSCSADPGALHSSKILTFTRPENASLTVRDIRVKGFTLDWTNLPGNGYEYAVAISHDGKIEDYETALENKKIMLDFTPSNMLNGTYKVTAAIPGKEYTIKLFVRAKNTKAAEYLRAKATLPYIDDAEIVNVWINGEEALYSRATDTYSYFYLPGSEEQDKEYTFTYKLMRQCALYINGEKVEDEVIPIKPLEPLEVTVVHERLLAARDYIIYIGTVDNGIPVIMIETEDNRGIYNNNDYIPAHFRIIDSREKPVGMGLYEGEILIRGRGNSSFSMPKRSYTVEIADKTQILDMSPSRDWMLLGNYTDKSLMRSYTAYELSRDMGAAFAPKLRFVDLILNSDYIGTYVLGERVKIDKGRLELVKIKAETTDPFELTGGYVLEVNSTAKYSSKEIIFETKKIKWSRGQFFSIKQPGTKNLPPEAYEYIKNYVNEAEDALFSEDFKDPQKGYRAYIDVASVIDWYLINELYKQVNANFQTKVYMYKPRGEKLYMGPVWDFNLGAGNANYSGCDDPEGWHVRTADWISRMFEDEAFAKEFKDRWNYVKNNYFSALFKRIDDTAQLIERSQQMNFAKWPILGVYVWPNAGNVTSRNTYKSEVEYLKDWLTQRIAWMDEEINK